MLDFIIDNLYCFTSSILKIPTNQGHKKTCNLTWIYLWFESSKMGVYPVGIHFEDRDLLSSDSGFKSLPIVPEIWIGCFSSRMDSHYVDMTFSCPLLRDWDSILMSVYVNTTLITSFGVVIWQMSSIQQ